jgi:DNA mismatch repair protein MutH
MMKKISIDELMLILETFRGKTLGDLNLKNRELDTKGAIGLLIEESILGYTVGNRSIPDIQHLGIEIKVTPVVQNRNGYVSKERLVLNLINYRTENWDDFYQSTVWKKNKKLLIIFYEYISGVAKKDYKILGYVIYEYPKIDLKIIKNDWGRIAQKVKANKAHEISESDGNYLGACTKGVSSLSVQKQSYSLILAKQRAYSLKKSYMTSVLNNYVLGSKTDERIIRDIKYLKAKTLEEYIIDCFKPYYGKTLNDLIDIFRLENHRESKAIYALITRKVLKIAENAEKTDEFKKSSIMPKTIRLEKNKSIIENMSFPSFKFTDIINQVWEDSDLFEILSESRFMFIVFERVSSESIYFLKKVQFWSMNDDDIAECERVWNKTIKIIKEGVVITNKGKNKYTNLPKSSESTIMHVRPHAVNGNDTNELPNGAVLTKHSFWLNRQYISNIIKVPESID